MSVSWSTNPMLTWSSPFPLSIVERQITNINLLQLKSLRSNSYPLPLPKESSLLIAFILNTMVIGEDPAGDFGTRSVSRATPPLPSRTLILSCLFYPSWSVSLPSNLACSFMGFLRASSSSTCSLSWNLFLSNLRFGFLDFLDGCLNVSSYCLQIGQVLSTCSSPTSRWLFVSPSPNSSFSQWVVAFPFPVL